MASVTCPICGLNLSELSASARDMHVNDHFRADPGEVTASPPTTPTFLNRVYDALCVDIGTRPSLNSTYQCWLCNPHVQCHASTRTDRHWSCGYRNTQTLLTSVSTGGGSPSPSLAQLQTWLEEAWSQGHDPVGADQLDHHVHGTTKWIGPTEVYGILRRIGLSCHIVDFHRPTGSHQSHPALLQCIVNYFQGRLTAQSLPEHGGSLTLTVNQSDAHAPAHPVVHTTLHPLYLQHQGHSRVILGVEQWGTGESLTTNLLVFDPEIPLTVYSTSTNPQQLLTRLRVTPRQLAIHRQYQLLILTPDLMDSPWQDGFAQAIHDTTHYTIKLARVP
ncbi:hypothetical protein IWQ62_005062 [Dispira parvispora]|uniref:UFSP1/2/DUB catalytic domain-containing protein n=1 Tax=Dispira parvispora TaxID=1520584 RepID=A0A9W8AQN2_9FUNG|nr:hypothetical protein IWQ62_005062 [Dispira parvispora]